MTRNENPFVALAAINVNDKVEKKNGLSYLSWAWAVDQLLRHDPLATWEYLEPVPFGQTLMVRCVVTAFGKAMPSHLPVMDHRNKAIANPDAFAVNTAMQRCLVKGIALHGLGLYIYAGEDLPDGEDSPKHGAERPGDGSGKIGPATGMLDSLELDLQNQCREVAHDVETLFKRGDLNGATDEWELQAERLNKASEFAKAGAWNLIGSDVRSAIKAEQVRRRKEKAPA
jgi:hypothetical protein